MLNAIKYLTILNCVLLLLIGNCTPGDNLAGSVTETGNVTGVVMSSSKQKVANAKVSLFKKKSEVMSPDEQTKPVEEVYTNDTGYFSFKADAGNFTIIAVSDSEYAFRDSIAPGKAGSKNMVIELRNPGKIKGIIQNSVELRGTGSVVVHLIGTSIYTNVDSDGSFLIDNVPAGTYTLVSYSTYQPEFSPKYQTVNVFSDSTTDLGGYSLTYNGIPIPKNVVVKYDTTNEVVRISWDSIGYFKDFQEYAIYRGIAGMAQHNLEQIGYTEGTTYIDSIKFTTDSLLKYEYSVLVHNKLGESGKYYGIYAVSCVPKFRLKAYAGEDQFVDIDSTVVLMGSTSYQKYPLKKMEWKIGDNDWAVTDSGRISFTMDNSHGKQEIICIFRAVDTAGNSAEDTVVVTKLDIEVTFGKVPSSLGGMMSSSSVIVRNHTTEKDGKLWFMGYNPTIWSTTDLATWNIDNRSTPTFQYYGDLIYLGSSYYYLSPKSKYKSDDMITWSKIADTLSFTGERSSFCAHNGKIVVIYKSSTEDSRLKDSLAISSDAITWLKRELPFNCSPRNLASVNGKLYYIGYNVSSEMYVSSDDGVTWDETNLWDNDFDIYPDYCRTLLHNDSIMVAIYNEMPSNKTKISLYKNDCWQDLCPTSAFMDELLIRECFLFNNHLLAVDRNGIIKGLKL